MKLNRERMKRDFGDRLTIEHNQQLSLIRGEPGFAANTAMFFGTLVDVLCDHVEAEHARWFDELFNARPGDWDQLVLAREGRDERVGEGAPGSPDTHEHMWFGDSCLRCGAVR